MNSEFKENVTRFFGNAVFALKQHSPEILLVAGIGGAIVGTVMACRATLKVNDILDDAKQEIDEIHNREIVYVDDTNVTAVSTNTQQELTKAYVKTGWRLVKLYAGPVILMTASLASIVGSTDIYKQRSLNAASAFMAISESMKDMEKRIEEKYGPEEARALKYGIEEKTVQEEITDENGEIKTVEKVEKTINSKYNPYVRIFKEGCKGWDSDPDMTLSYLKCTRETFSKLLRAHGHIMLNDVLAELGFPTTREGQSLGWYFDPKNPKYQGKRVEELISFGIENVGDGGESNFASGKCPFLILEFDCDGDIVDKVWPDERGGYEFDVR